MAGSVTRGSQSIPVSSASQGVGTIAASSTGLDGTEVPYVILVDEASPDKPGFGVDSSDANATQATGGIGARGWLSTLVSLFRAGTAKANIGNLTQATDTVSTVAQPGAPNTALTFSSFSASTPSIGDVSTSLVSSMKDKTLLIIVSTGFTWTTSGQPTIKLYTSVLTQATSSTGDPTVTAGNAPTVGVAANLGPAAATSLGVGVWAFTASSLAELAHPFAYLGVRISLPSQPSAGVVTAMFVAPNA